MLLSFSAPGDFEEALEKAAKDVSLFSTYGTVFVVVGAIVLVVVVSIIVFELVQPGGGSRNITRAMILVAVVLLLVLLGFVIYTILSHKDPHGNDKEKGREPSSDLRKPEQVKETTIPAYSLVCTVGDGMNEATAFPEDGLCDYNMLEVLPVKLGGPYPKRVEHFLDVASKHRRTQYGMGFDSEKVHLPDLFISIGHYAYHDINMADKCRLLPATFLQPPLLDKSEQYKYTFGLESATKHVADLDKLRDKDVEAPALSVSVGLYGRWHFVDSKQGTKLEDHRPGSQCLPVVNDTQKTGIYEVCVDPKYRILDDDKFHCKFTLGKTNDLLKVMVFDTAETLRHKVCSSKKNATQVKYGITAAQLEYADSSGHCKNGTFPLLRALKQIVKFFKDNYTSEANFENCVALGA
ncbi:hypothetical protein MTO96_028062 [Rhipicephalus appendiculatus]